MRVEVHDETGTWNVYNAYAEPKQRLDFNLTAVGTAELDVFVNDGLDRLDETRRRTAACKNRKSLGPPPKGSHPPSTTDTSGSATAAPT